MPEKKQTKRSTKIKVSGKRLGLFASNESKRTLKLFFNPLLKQLKTNHSLYDQLFFLMGGDHRTIELYKVTTTIERIKGLYALAGARFCEGRGIRHFPANDSWYCTVRKDNRTPDVIDVEFFQEFSDFNKGHQFRLTAREFSYIVDCITLIENKPKYSRK